MTENNVRISATHPPSSAACNKVLLQLLFGRCTHDKAVSISPKCRIPTPPTPHATLTTQVGVHDTVGGDVDFVCFEGNLSGSRSGSLSGRRSG